MSETNGNTIINARPKWDDIAPGLIEMTQSDDRKQSLTAYGEIRKMAILADMVEEMIQTLWAAKGTLATGTEAERIAFADAIDADLRKLEGGASK